MDATTEDFNIRVETRLTLANVWLNGDLVGSAEFDNNLRAPKKWLGLLAIPREGETPELVGMFKSATEAAFAVALVASDKQKAKRIVEKLALRT